MPDTKTIEVKVYTLAELKEVNYSAYEKVINRHAGYVMEDVTWINECLETSMEETMKARGYYLDPNKNSGFEWETDHGGFIGWCGSVNKDLLITRYGAEKGLPASTRRMLHNLARAGELDIWVSKVRGYHTGVKIECDYSDGRDADNVTYTRRNDATNLFDAWLEQDLRKLAGDLLRDINKEYEYQTSEEVIAENLTEGERVFLEDGSETTPIN